jgi:uncharacterized damage-inducible protein DinB
MSVDFILKYWILIRDGLLQTIDAFQDQELDFVAYPQGRTVRQIALHIAHEEHGEFAYGITQELDHFPADYADTEYPDRQSIKNLLDSVHGKTISYLREKTTEELNDVIQTPWGAEYRLIEMLTHLIEHEVHHRGELSLILGILGRKGYDA